MRNAIRNILSNWRNIFGRQLTPPNGLPYSFTVQNSVVNVSALAGVSPLLLRETYWKSGVEYHKDSTVTNNYSWLNTGVDVGSTYTLESLSGTCIRLYIDGHEIFDYT